MNQTVEEVVSTREKAIKLLAKYEPTYAGTLLATHERWADALGLALIKSLEGIQKGELERIPDWLMKLALESVTTAKNAANIKKGDSAEFILDDEEEMLLTHERRRDNKMIAEGLSVFIFEVLEAGLGRISDISDERQKGGYVEKLTGAREM